MPACPRSRRSCLTALLPRRRRPCPPGRPRRAARSCSWPASTTRAPKPQLRKAIEADPTSAPAPTATSPWPCWPRRRTARPSTRHAWRPPSGRSCPEARYIYGLALAADGRPVEAARELEKAVALKPGRGRPRSARWRRPTPPRRTSAPPRRTRSSIALRPDERGARAPSFAEYLWRSRRSTDGKPRRGPRRWRPFPRTPTSSCATAGALFEQDRFCRRRAGPRGGPRLGGPGTPRRFALLAERPRAGGQHGCGPHGARGRPSRRTADARPLPTPAISAASGSAGARPRALPQLEEAAQLSPDACEVQLDLGPRPRNARPARRGRGRLPPRDQARPELSPGALRPRAPPAAAGDKAEARAGARDPPRALRAGRKAVSRYERRAAEIALAWAELNEGKAADALARFQAPAARRPDALLGQAHALSRLERHARGGRGARESARSSPRTTSRIELLLATERSRAEEASDPLCRRSSPPARRARATARSRSPTSPPKAGIRVRPRPGRDPRAPPSRDRGLGPGLARLRQRRLDGPLRRAGRSLSRRPGARRPQDRLYRNNGNGTFTDVTEKAGLERHAPTGWAPSPPTTTTTASSTSTSPTTGGNILYHNNGNGTFTDVTAKAGVAGPRLGHQRRVGRHRRRRLPRPLRGAVRRRPQGQGPLLRRSRPRASATTARPSCIDGTRQRPLPQQRQRHLHRRHARGGPRQGRRQGPRRPLRRLRPRREARPLRRQRRADELPLPQPRRRALRGHLRHLGHRLRPRGQSAGRHGRRRRRPRRRRPAGHRRGQLRGGDQRVLPQPRIRSLRGPVRLVGLRAADAQLTSVSA